MKKYSEFINFPINLWASKEVDMEVPADEDESSDEEESCAYLEKTFTIFSILIYCFVLDLVVFMSMFLRLLLHAYS